MFEAEFLHVNINSVQSITEYINMINFEHSVRRRPRNDVTTRATAGQGDGKMAAFASVIIATFLIYFSAEVQDLPKALDKQSKGTPIYHVTIGRAKMRVLL